MTDDHTAIDFTGMAFADVCALLGKAPAAAKVWLGRHSYRWVDGRVRRIRRATDVQDEVAARIAAAPPSGPCFLCGVRAGCKHRPTTITNGAPA